MSSANSQVTVSDVMLRRPKTLPADVTVADARAALVHASVQMLLLVDGNRFYGALTAIPDHAAPQVPAIEYVDTSAPVVAEVRRSRMRSSGSSTGPTVASSSSMGTSSSDSSALRRMV